MSDTTVPKIIGKYEEVIVIEDEHLLLRRQKLYGPGETKEKLDHTRFGIALSGSFSSVLCLKGIPGFLSLMH